jgi:hypothetical protein
MMQSDVASASANQEATRAGRRGAEAIVLAILSVPLLIALIALAYRSTLLIAINYNEGWNAYHAAAALSGGRLYYPANALVTNNYPPLSFIIVGVVSNIVGDAVFAGRLVVWIGFLGTAFLIHAILRRLGNDPVASASGAMLFTAYSVVQFNVYVGVYDPQWLAHAVMLLGLWLYFREPDAPKSSVAAGVVMGLALFIKHNILALPVAFVLWLFLYDRRASVRFAAAGLVTGGLGLAACYAAFGPDFFSGLLAPRTYSAIDGYRYGLAYLEPMEIPLVIFALGAIVLRDRYAKFFLLLASVALPLGLIERTGAGVAINSVFEVVIALSLGVGHLMGHAPIRGLRLWVIGACATALIINVGVGADRSIYLIRPWIAQQRAKAAQTREQIALLTEHPGPAICETPALCYWAHKPFEVDPFNFVQGVRAGIKDDRELLQRVASGYYGAVEVIPGLGSDTLAGILRDSLTNYPPPKRFEDRAFYVK